MLDELLPRRSEIVDRWRSRLDASSCSSLRMGGDWATAGKAVEIRLGLDVADEPEHWHALSYLAPDRCEQILTVAGYAFPEVDSKLDPLLRAWHRHRRPTYDLNDPAHGYALGSCYYAAHLADIGYAARHTLSISERRRIANIAGEPDLGVTDRLSQVDTQTGLAHLWRHYQDYGRSALLALGDRVLVSVPVGGGYGEADLVVGRTVVDIKVAQATDAVDKWLDQVLAYALLDRLNTLFLTDVAVYAAWQGVLLHANLEEVIEAAAPAPAPTLSEIRDRFAMAMAPDLDDSERNRAAHRYPPPPDAWTVPSGPES